MNLLYHDEIPRNLLNCFEFLGVGMFKIAFTLSGSVFMLPEPTTRPKYVNSFSKKWHLSGFSCNFAFRSLLKISFKFFTCSSYVFPITTMSSKYANAKSISGPIILSNNRWNVAGAACNPNGRTRNWNKPLPGTVNAVIGRLSLLNGICQYPCLRASVDIYNSLFAVCPKWLIYMGEDRRPCVPRNLPCESLRKNDRCCLFS